MTCSSKCWQGEEQSSQNWRARSTQHLKTGRSDAKRRLPWGVQAASKRRPRGQEGRGTGCHQSFAAEGRIMRKTCLLAKGQNLGWELGGPAHLNVEHTGSQRKGSLSRGPWRCPGFEGANKRAGTIMRRCCQGGRTKGRDRVGRGAARAAKCNVQQERMSACRGEGAGTLWDAGCSLCRRAYASNCASEGGALQRELPLIGTGQGKLGWARLGSLPR
jgi:hypothetical protein